MKEVELTQYNAVTGILRHILTIRDVSDWVLEGNILYILQGESKRSAYVLSEGDSLKEIGIE